jgi:hypothetical protein
MVVLFLTVMVDIWQRSDPGFEYSLFWRIIIVNLYILKFSCKNSQVQMYEPPNTHLAYWTTVQLYNQRTKTLTKPPGAEVISHRIISDDKTYDEKGMTCLTYCYSPGDICVRLRIFRLLQYTVLQQKQPGIILLSRCFSTEQRKIRNSDTHVGASFPLHTNSVLNRVRCSSILSSSTVVYEYCRLLYMGCSIDLNIGGILTHVMWDWRLA